MSADSGVARFYINIHVLHSCVIWYKHILI